MGRTWLAVLRVIAFINYSSFLRRLRVSFAFPEINFLGFLTYLRSLWYSISKEMPHQLEGLRSYARYYVGLVGHLFYVSNDSNNQCSYGLFQCGYSRPWAPVETPMLKFGWIVAISCWIVLYSFSFAIVRFPLLRAPSGFTLCSLLRRKIIAPRTISVHCNTTWSCDLTSPISRFLICIPVSCISVVWGKAHR